VTGDERLWPPIRLMLLVLGVLTASATARATRLDPVVDAITPGTWTMLRVIDLDTGPARLDSGAAVTVWDHPGGAVVVPALVPPEGPTPWSVTLNGEAMLLQVRLLMPGESIGAETVAPDVRPDLLAVPDPLRAVMPSTYEAIAGWRPTRPAAERGWTVLTAGGVIVAVAVLVLRGGRSRWAGLVLLASGAVAFTAWREFRPGVAVREAILTAGPTVADRWTFFTAPDRLESEAVDVAFAGYTLPVAFSAEHLALMEVVLTCDPSGRPTGLSVVVPPGSAAAVVQRTSASMVDPPPEWTRPIRRLYRRSR
jgi:hypothetical protein